MAISMIQAGGSLVQVGKYQGGPVGSAGQEATAKNADPESIHIVYKSKCKRKSNRVWEKGIPPGARRRTASICPFRL